MPLNNEAKIRNRIASGKSMNQAKHLVHRLRRLTAGDISALDDRVGMSAAEQTMRPHYKDPGDSGQFYDVLVQDVEEGRSNKLMQAVRTLVLQTANSFPEIEFEGLNPKLATVNSRYCKQRMTRCGARHQVRLALTDYIISGLGCCITSLKDDYPVIQWVDILDMSWDLTAKLPHEMRWAAWKITNPLHLWKKMYKDGRKYNKAVFDKFDSEDEERPISLWWYFDADGDEGTHACFLARDEEVDDVPIFVGKNPYKTFLGGESSPRIPFRFMYHLALPSVKWPESIVAHMLPSQIALWESDRSIRDTIAKGTPYYEPEEGAYDVKKFNDWLNAKTGGVLWRKAQARPMETKEPLAIPPAWIEWRNLQDKELVAQGGHDPYSLGNKVEGIQYAAEVNAIQGNSSLVAGSITKDGAEFWQGLASDFLNVGKQFDDMPISIQFDEDISLHFDKTERISDLLMPDADIVCEEDTMQFMPKSQRIQIATALLTQASTPAALARTPNAYNMAMEKFLRAIGIRNVSEWVKPPQMAPQAPGMPGMPGMTDPGMMGQAQAGANTA